MATTFIKWASVSSSLALGAWSLMITRTVHRVKPSSISVYDTSEESFLHSQTCSAVVNPRRHQVTSDTRSIQFHLPPSKTQYSDEQILATFVKGFFGGWVFAAEGALLGAVKRIPKSREESIIWSSKALDEKTLPALHATLFGAFQLVDRCLDVATTNVVHTPAQSSYVDFAFGSDESSFAGAHRFIVHRDHKPGARGGDVIRITFASMVCNPTQNKPMFLASLYAFHRFYAQLLFREAVAHVFSRQEQTAL
ncbi:uncharacterized protein A1O9_12674 [Exophiala aquamarina CBS 119918]|uniref:DUF1990 domain-containing protein n=1 Tax=Exophiala aquamarina CBS 119918 TaxID=1182545 RepID=A0A072NTZ7_9EURO|nr:uncharacterized protein A1O9_12674 [Exophiala aquamarina CBS 119918]KEF51324.1 hypothetical protein A1O9_12674 [Exophiala aquamarina CBS 119918]